MKTNFFIGFIVYFSMSLIFSSCSNDDDSVNNTDVSQLMDIAETGTWRISSYIDSGADETSDFTGYNFTFSPNGNLIASNGETEVTGTWSITDDSNSSDDDDSSSDDDTDFNIFFASPPNFEDLTDDWDIVSMNNTTIELIDISGGNGGTDNLVFTKN
jgi:hypothetical protein